MKKQPLFSVTCLILITIFFSHGVFAVQDLPIKVEKISRNVLQINNVSEAVYSLSGKFIAIQNGSSFFLLPTQNLDKSLVEIQKFRSWSGNIIGFLPSELFIYSNQTGIFALNPIDLTEQSIFPANIAKNFYEKRLTRNEILIVSNDLIISGDGSYDWGAEKGNIFKFDLKRKLFFKGAQIYAFWYASVSPSRKYVLYEHGAEANNNADLYDISRNKNYPVSEYFNFKKEFPNYKVTDESPIAWIGTDKFLAEVSDNGDAVEKNNSFLVLFDVAAKKTVWKKSVDKYLFPTAFQQLNAEKALVNYENEVFELSLTDGKTVKIPTIEGSSIAVSPDKTKVAFFNSNQLFVAAVNGDDKKSILELPAEWKHQNAYKGMGERTPLWSANGDSLILFAENQLLLVRLQ